jgi:hypothetical protein
MFLVALYWRGAMNIESMRVKPTLQDAVNYLVHDLDYNQDDFNKGFYRIYETFASSKPRLIRRIDVEIENALKGKST